MSKKSITKTNTFIIRVFKNYYYYDSSITIYLLRSVVEPKTQSVVLRSTKRKICCRNNAMGEAEKRNPSFNVTSFTEYLRIQAIY